MIKLGTMSSHSRILSAGLLLILGVCMAAPARGATAAALLDEAAVTQLEQQALAAEPREQVFLLTEVLHQLTERAGKQISDGDEEHARATLRHADQVMARMHSAVGRDAKRLKNAEQALSMSARRLGDMLHGASGDSREVIQATLGHLNALHTEVLAQVFSQ